MSSLTSFLMTTTSAALLAGCATRALPPAFPATSAAAASAPAAAPAPVTTTLRSDPPLPGDDLAEWAGLEAAEPTRGAAPSRPHDHAGHAEAPKAPSAAAPGAPTTLDRGGSHAH